MKRDQQESNNIKKVLNSFSRTSSDIKTDAPVTYIIGNTIYSINSKGEQIKVKEVEKNVKVTKRIYQVRANKTNSDICGA